MSTAAPDEPVDPLLLRQVTNRLDRLATEVVERHDVTLDQWRMLERLVATGAGTMSELSTSLALSGPTTTRVADRLVTMALAYRDADALDRRRVLLRAAERGRRLYEGLAPEVHAAQDSALRDLTGDERHILADLLRRMISVTADDAYQWRGVDISEVRARSGLRPE